MPTQVELLEEAKVARLKEIAATYGIDVTGVSGKEALVDAIASSRKISKAEVEAELDEENQEYEGDAPAATGADVDVAELSDKKYKGEVQSPITVGSWVRLAAHDDVPDRYVGHIAVVLDSPTAVVDDGKLSPHPYEVQKKDALITVRTRDEASAELTLPVEAFSEVSPTGRLGVHPIG